MTPDESSRTLKRNKNRRLAFMAQRSTAMPLGRHNRFQEFLNVHPARLRLWIGQEKPPRLKIEDIGLRRRPRGRIIVVVDVGLSDRLLGVKIVHRDVEQSVTNRKPPAG